MDTWESSKDSSCNGGVLSLVPGFHGQKWKILTHRSNTVNLTVQDLRLKANRSRNMPSVVKCFTDRIAGKIMFLQASVCPQGGRCEWVM